MSSWNSLPVFGPDHELLYHAPIASVPRLLESGRVRPVGTKNRVRALVAVCGDVRDLVLDRPAGGVKFIGRGESDDNPAGVWTFKRRSFYAA